MQAHAVPSTLACPPLQTPTPLTNQPVVAQVQGDERGGCASEERVGCMPWGGNIVKKAMWQVLAPVSS